jgi:hypothetical protein
VSEQSVETPDHAPLGAAKELLLVIGGLFVGIVAASLLLFRVLIPALGLPGDLDRVASIPTMARETSGQARRVQIVSNSVGMEGIDASVVSDALGGDFTVQNFSANGIALVGARVVMGELLATKPEAIVWILLPGMIGDFEDVHPDLGATMRLANLQTHNQWIQEAAMRESAPELAAQLGASTLRNRLTLRTTPLAILNDRVRLAAVSDILPAKPRDLDAPFRMARAVGPRALDRHLADVLSNHQARTAGAERAGLDLIAKTLAEISGAGVVPVIVIAPAHERIRAELEPVTQEMRDAISGLMATHGGFVIDASDALGASDFADAIHTNAEGRERFSAFLGEALRSRFEEQSRGGS